MYEFCFNSHYSIALNKPAIRWGYLLYKLLSNHIKHHFFDYVATHSLRKRSKSTSTPSFETNESFGSTL